MKKFEQYCDKVSRLYPELHHIDYDGRVLSQSVTFQVTDDCNLACCFVAGTKVLMANGSYKNIEDIVINDKVIAFDDSNNYFNKNVDQFFFLYDEVETITFTDGTSITGTFNHEIFTTNGSKEIKDINVGDIVLSYRGTKTVKDKIYMGEQPVFNIGVADLHTYVANGVLTKNCYCYQIHKGKRKMSFETAKKFIDMIISGEKGMYEYINPIKSPGLVVDFIGGEPFMEIELIDQICSYLMDRLIEMQHPWAMRTMFSICSNGVLYRDEKVQKFLSKWANRLSFSVTVDGNKELHDACRVFHDGSPSYDLAIDAVTDWMGRGYYMGSKITIAPENISFLYDAVKHMVELGYDEINANCVYEKGWTPVHATVLYDQMKRISDYFLDGNFDFEHHMYCSLYNEKFFHPKDENDLQPWCFRAGTKILTPDGNKNIEDLHIGDKVISGSGKIQVVENVMKHYSEKGILIKAEKIDDIYTTYEHPFMTSTGEWVEAGSLNSESQIILFTSDKNKNIQVLSVEETNGYEVYNLTVSEDHTFIANGVIVHNCGGVGNSMIACDPDGVIFPCIRYMESSLGGDQIPYSIGDVDNGIAYNDCTKCRIKCMAKVDRRTQSTDECFYCPIAEGCSNCSAYDYQINGTPDSRATFICIMHKARALANAYFWNKYYRKNNMKKRMKIHVPDSWALEIISQSELNMLKDLAKEDY